MTKQQEKLPIRFSRPALIVGAGSVDDATLRQMHASQYALVAADGAADFLHSAGMIPDLIVGDLDSLSDPTMWTGRSRIVHLPEQDTTDFEKCLYATDAPLYLGFGLTGKRFDHSLATLHILTKYAGHKQVIIIDETDIIIAITGPFAAELQPGERVSVYPLEPVLMARSVNLKYPLDGLRLSQGQAVGTSNQATGRSVEIFPEENNTASYCVILPKANLEAMIERLTAKND